MEGQINLRDAMRPTIQFKSPEGKEYRLKQQVAVLLVRARGWHLREKHFLVDGGQLSGSLCSTLRSTCSTTRRSFWRVNPGPTLFAKAREPS